MKKKTRETISEDRFVDSSLHAANPAFAPAELIVCKQCERAGSPNRTNCLYCGAELEIAFEQSKSLKPNLRPIEDWEKGFNVILSGAADDFDDAKIEEISAFLQSETSFLRQLIELEKPLPVARVGSERSAENIRQFFAGAEIVGDEELSIEKPPRRLRAIDFWDDKLVLILFNRDEIVEITPNDLRLIVTGTIFERRVEATEARVKKGENKLVETNETASDEFLIDLYDSADRIGFRVEQNGFDFSCLGAEKTLIAAQNIRSLVKKLSAVAPDAKLVEDYSSVRSFLANVWQVAEKKDSRGMKRESFGKFNLENVTTVSNSAQFTKYSRLQRHLFLKI